MYTKTEAFRVKAYKVKGHNKKYLDLPRLVFAATPLQAAWSDVRVGMGVREKAENIWAYIAEERLECSQVYPYRLYGTNSNAGVFTWSEGLEECIQDMKKDGRYNYSYISAIEPLDALIQSRVGALVEWEKQIFPKPNKYGMPLGIRDTDKKISHPSLIALAYSIRMAMMLPIESYSTEYFKTKEKHFKGGSDFYLDDTYVSEDIDDDALRQRFVDTHKANIKEAVYTEALEHVGPSLDNLTKKQSDTIDKFVKAYGYDPDQMTWSDVLSLWRFGPGWSKEAIKYIEIKEGV